jgi:transmembrane sensor
MLSPAVKSSVYAGTAAAAILYVILGGGPSGAGSSWNGYSTGVGEIRHLLLSEHERLDLNTDSEIHTRLETNGQHIVLARGEAHFKVDGGHRAPVLISVGNAELRASAAQFSVHRWSERQIDLVVEDGRVELRFPSVRYKVEDWFRPPLSLPLSAGDSISLLSSSVKSRERLPPAALRRRTAWTEGWLWFYQAPLPEVLAEFNRYHRQQLVLVDPALASLEIGGRFRSNDLESFIATLEHSFNVRARSAAVPGAGAGTIYLTGRCGRAKQQCNWSMVQ